MKLLILDRDGVINEDSDAYIKSPEEWQSIPGSSEAIAALSRAGFLITVATNQSGLARGLFSEIDLANMHQKMCAEVESFGGRIDGVFYCPHHPEDGCDCRKPRTGLLGSIAREFAVELAGAFYVGDSEKDLQCARAVGAVPILVRTGKGRVTESRLDPEVRNAIQVFDNLAQAAAFLQGEAS